MGASPVIDLSHISLTFPLNGVTACDDINLTLSSGETVVLMGENGAGKSTLAAIMGGVLKPDEGEVEFSRSGPAGIVHQKPHYADSMTVRDMVFGANRTLKGGFFYSAKTEGKRLQGMLELLESRLVPETLMSDLAPYQIQESELAENLLMLKDMIILDEPEFPNLGRILSILKERGISPVIITHKIRDALEFGDRVIVMGKGKILLDRKKGGAGLQEEILESLVRNKKIVSEQRESSRKGKGRIRVIAGYHESGLWDEEVRLAHIMASDGNGYIPSLNRRKAMEESWSPVDNLMIHDRRRYRMFGGFLNKRRYIREGFTGLNRYGIVARPEDRMVHLSGGNQKKLLLVREFQRPGGEILLSEPSTALDLANRDFLYDLILQAKNEGKNITLLTSDPEEAMTLGDEIIPLFKGKRGEARPRLDYTLPELIARMGGAPS